MNNSALTTINGELDAVDGVVDQARAMKHLSGTLSDYLQRLLLNEYRRCGGDSVNVKVLLSMSEIQRLLWIAENISDRAENLDNRIDVIYNAVQDASREERTAA